MPGNAPSVQTGTYPIADEVMQLARAMVNDMLRDTKGRILTNSAPFAVPYLNSAIRRCQRYFANNGLENFIVDNAILSNMTPCQSQDPSVQTWISANGYFDGAVVNSQPRLPSDLILPLSVWFRQSGSGAAFTMINPAHGDGIPSRTPGQMLDVYEWRNDKLNFNGSTLTLDLRLRYEGAIPAIGTSQDLTQVSIPLRDAHEALAMWVVYFYAFARGSVMRQECEKSAIEQMDQVIDRHVRKDERIAYRPEGFSAGGSVDGSLTGSTR